MSRFDRGDRVFVRAGNVREFAGTFLRYDARGNVVVESRENEWRILGGFALAIDKRIGLTAEFTFAAESCRTAQEVATENAERLGRDGNA